MTKSRKRADVHLLNAELVISQGPMRSPRWVKDHPQLVEDVAMALRSVEHRTLMAAAKRLRKAAETMSTRGATVYLAAAEVFEEDAKKLEKQP